MKKSISFEGIAKVGDVIKAYDFQPMSDRPDRYLIGVVSRISPWSYVIEDVVQYVDGKQVHEFDNECEVPFNAFLDWEGRVNVISE